jgi:hypothetical protein
MMGVAGLAVLGMTARLAGAQTVEVKEKPPLYRYVSYWTFPQAHWAGVDKDNATGNRKILAPALADGTLVGYGDGEEQSGEGFTHEIWWQADSNAGLMKVLEAFHKGGGSSSPPLASSTKHSDQVFVSHFYNRKAGSWEGAYGYTSTYRLKPDAPGDAVRRLSSLLVPLFEKLLADGTIVEYEIDRESVRSTDSRPQLVVLIPSAEHLDKLNSAIDAAIDENPQIGLALASMAVDWVRVNATYK